MNLNKTQYSLMAAVLLGSHHLVNAQVQYTDIDPDFVIDDEDGYIFLDIDDNGTDDFVLGMGELTYTIGSGTFKIKLYGPAIGWSFENDNDLLADVINNDNAIFAFAYNYESGVYFGEGNYWLGTATDFAHQAFICAQSYANGFSFGYPVWNFLGQRGFWQDVQTDRYLGIRFQDGLDRTHYGWIRCDAPDSGRVLVIKDYAYETQAGVGIIAGDMGEAVGIQTEHELLFSLYPNPAEDWIEIRYYENEQLYADIRNLEGKLLLTQALQSGSANRLPVADLPMGTYVAVIRNETGEVKGKQVWVKSR
ncbi:MAG: T9SS type A sorting domain-containing protein [Chitinophagales bacterium]